MKPCARGPGVSAMGGAGVGDGERESGIVAEGILELFDAARQAKDREVATKQRITDRRGL